LGAEDLNSQRFTIRGLFRDQQVAGSIPAGGSMKKRLNDILEKWLAYCAMLFRVALSALPPGLMIVSRVSK
jgi:hypothetical protein